MDKELLYRYFEGTASEEEMQTIKSWAEEDTENEKLLRRERKLFDAIILSGQRKQEEKLTENVPLKRTRLLLWAAAIALVVGIATLLKLYLPQKANLVAMQKITVPVGQRVNIMLPDSTMVWLNSASTLEYASNYGEKSRDVILNGEGMFEVKHDADKHFVVHTIHADITDLGTKFNVQAYAQTFTTALLEGKVSVSRGDEILELRPHEQVSLKAGKLFKSKVSNEEDMLSWKDGIYAFHDKTFTDIMSDFEKYYNTKIVIATPSAFKNIRLSGKFRFTDGLDYALRVLQAEVSYTFDRNEDTEEIVIKKK